MLRFFRNHSVAIRVCAIVIAIFWMAIIYSFSGQNSEESSEVSLSVSYRMVQTMSGVCNLGWSSDKILAVSQTIENAVRKAAHMTEYGILAFFWGMGLDAWLWWKQNEKEVYGKRKLLGMILPLAICTLYAATDEYHQTLIPGRNGCVRDVFIDAAGALIALSLVYLITRAVVRKQSENK